MRRRAAARAEADQPKTTETSTMTADAPSYLLLR
jgi:hypothetical protein